MEIIDYVFIAKDICSPMKLHFEKGFSDSLIKIELKKTTNNTLQTDKKLFDGISDSVVVIYNYYDQ